MIIPVRAGIMNPPKNNNNQIKSTTNTNESIKGTGIATQHDKNPKKHTTPSIPGAWYPPRLWITNPPAMTPNVGAVTQRRPNVIKACDAGILSIRSI
jgi:hypothetical protein